MPKFLLTPGTHWCGLCYRHIATCLDSSTGVHTCYVMPHFLMDTWKLNSGSLACASGTLPPGHLSSPFLSYVLIHKFKTLCCLLTMEKWDIRQWRCRSCSFVQVFTSCWRAVWNRSLCFQFASWFLPVGWGWFSPSAPLPWGPRLISVSRAPGGVVNFLGLSLGSLTSSS